MLKFNPGLLKGSAYSLELRWHDKIFYDVMCD